MSLTSPIESVTLRFINVNGIKMRVAEAGAGPLMILAHGWPESWYTWRHQLSFFANHGYHVIAPDMRGYGASDAPAAVEAYDIMHLSGDILGLLEAFGRDKAVLVGHDWGAVVAWHAALMHPERFTALIAMSVPYTSRSSRSPLDIWQDKYGDAFYYMLYHNEPGVAEAEYDANPRDLLSRLYLSPNSPREAPAITDPKRSAGGWLGRLGAARGLPDWLSQADLDYLVEQFKATGFQGGLSYYRNIHRNWLITEHLQSVKVMVPTIFIAGEHDVVIAGATAEALIKTMHPLVSDLRGVHLVEGVGHWVQQEAPLKTSNVMLEFLNSL